MKPISLAFKDLKTNPYTGKTSGELTIVHQCLGCTKISCNRIAGDDNSYSIICLLENSTKPNKDLITRLTSQNIILLTQKDRSSVLTILYGCNYQKHIH